MKRIIIAVLILFLSLSSYTQSADKDSFLTPLDSKLKKIEELIKSSKYETAYNDLKKTKTPKETLESAKLNLFKMYFFREVLHTHSDKEKWLKCEQEKASIINERASVSKEKTSERPPFMFIDKKEAADLIENAFNNIWKERESLKDIPKEKITKYTYEGYGKKREELVSVLDVISDYWEGLNEHKGTKSYSDIENLVNPAYNPEFTKEFSLEKKLNVLNYRLEAAKEKKAISYLAERKLLFVIENTSYFGNKDGIDDLVKKSFVDIKAMLLADISAKDIYVERDGNTSAEIWKYTFLDDYTELLEKTYILKSNEKRNICEELINAYGLSYNTGACSRIIYDAISPFVSTSALSRMEQRPNTPIPLNLSSNKDLTLELYKIDMKKQLKAAAEESHNHYLEADTTSFLRDRVHTARYANAFKFNEKNAKLVKSWRSLKKERIDDEEKIVPVVIPAIKDKGFYFLKITTDKYTETEKEMLKKYVLKPCEEEQYSPVADEKYKKEQLSKCQKQYLNSFEEQRFKYIPINITDIALITTSGVNLTPKEAFKAKKDEEAGIFNLYPLSMIDGAIMKDVNITYQDSVDFKEKTAKAKESKPVSLKFPMDEKLGWGIEISAYAQKDGAYSVMTEPMEFSYINRFQEYEIEIQKDKPIYKPGDELKLKARILKRTENGLIAPKEENAEISFTLAYGRDENIMQKVLLNSIGTASTSFNLPLAGEYTIWAEYKSRRVFETISVYPYKAADIAIDLQTPQKPLTLNKDVKLTGKVNNITGMEGAVANVSYKVHVRDYNKNEVVYPNSFELVATGQTKTSKNGNFEFNFKTVVLAEDAFDKERPKDTSYKLNPKSNIMEYKVIASASNKNMDEVSVEKFILASDREDFFYPLFTKNYYKTGDTLEFAISAEDINSLAKNTQAEISIAKLKNKKEQVAGKENSDIQLLFASAETEKVVFDKKLVFKNGKSENISIENIETGVYRLSILSENKKDKSEVIFLVIDPLNLKSLHLPSVVIPEYGGYGGRGDVEVLLGNSILDGNIHIELMQNDFVVYKSTLNNGMNLLKLNLPYNIDSNYTLNWFTVKDYSFYSASTDFSLESEKEIYKVKLTTDKKEYPAGSTVSTDIQVFDSEGSPAKGELLLRGYNTSLNSFHMFQKENLQFLWMPFQERLENGYRTSFNIQQNALTPVKDWDWDAEEEGFDAIPSYYTRPGYKSHVRTQFHSFWSRFQINDTVMYSMAPPGSYITTPSSFGGKKRYSSFGSSNYTNSESLPFYGVIKSDLKDSILFEPHINISDGKTSSQFSLSDYGAKWHILANFITESGASAFAEIDVLSAAKFSADIYSPAFLREGDESMIFIPLINTSNKKVTVKLALEIAKNEEEYKTVINKKYTLSPNKNIQVSYPLKALLGDKEFRVRLNFDHDGKNTSIERILPIKSSAPLVPVTKAAMLKQDDNNFKVSKDSKNAFVSLNYEAIFYLLSENSDFQHDFIMKRDEEDYNSELEGNIKKYVQASILEYVFTNNPELHKKMMDKNTKDISSSKEIVLWQDKFPFSYYTSGFGGIPDLKSIGKIKKESFNEVQRLFKLVEYSNYADYEYFLILLQKAYDVNKDDNFLKIKEDLHPFVAIKAYYALKYLKETDSGEEVLFGTHESKEDKLKHKLSSDIFKIYPLVYYLDDNLNTKPYKTYKEETFTAKNTLEEFKAFIDGYRGELNVSRLIFMSDFYSRVGESDKAEQYLKNALSKITRDVSLGSYIPYTRQEDYYDGSKEAAPMVLISLLKNMKDKEAEASELARFMLTHSSIYFLHDKETTSYLVSVLNFADYKDMEKANIFIGNLNIDAGLKETFVPVNVSNAIINIKNTSANNLGIGYVTVWEDSNNKLNKEKRETFQLSKKYFKRYLEGNEYKLKELKSGDKISLSDEIEVHLELNVPSNAKNLFVRDPKIASFEYQPMERHYSIQSDYSDPYNIYFYMENGIIKYKIKPSMKGKYTVPPSVMQNIFFPELNAVSESYEFFIVD